ncbi:hypothetical protein D3C76_1542980 [compost metagenome]
MDACIFGIRVVSFILAQSAAQKNILGTILPKLSPAERGDGQGVGGCGVGADLCRIQVSSTPSMGSLSSWGEGWGEGWPSMSKKTGA